MKLSYSALIALLIILGLLLSACSTGSGVMAASGGTYTVTKTGTTGFTLLGSLRSGAYEEANNFAGSKKMVAEVISVNEVPAGFARWPQVDLRFRLVKPNARDSEGKSPTIVLETQGGNDAMGNSTASETTVTTSQESDFYTELKKLGELKDKGLLTEEEFQKEKKLLINAQGK